MVNIFQQKKAQDDDAKAKDDAHHDAEDHRRAIVNRLIAHDVPLSCGLSMLMSADIGDADVDASGDNDDDDGDDN